ncbi:MAG: hypothetical protein EZS28_029426 [Streblomastix strix]|uniref:Uncharacterized protein n=1 Tax=Streblomastix strix TaxID=222440 RepID=A0A5J4UXI5_9EUKA|nr:MAG: hypothetical protein EZS28_029426 [Streblomastix strix]
MEQLNFLHLVLIGESPLLKKFVHDSNADIQFTTQNQSQIDLNKLKQTLSTFTTLTKSNFKLHPFITLVVTYNIEFLQLNPRLVSTNTKDSSISVSSEAEQSKADIALITLAIAIADRYNIRYNPRSKPFPGAYAAQLNRQDVLKKIKL